MESTGGTGRGTSISTQISVSRHTDSDPSHDSSVDSSRGTSTSGNLAGCQQTYTLMSDNSSDAEPSTSEKLASEPTTTEVLEDQCTQLTNLSPLAGPVGMAARREFTSIPLTQAGAFDAYKHLTADDFAGPSDIRLRQLSNSAEVLNNDIKFALADGMPVTDNVSGRAKTPESTFGKLREPFDPINGGAPTIAQVTDLSGFRVSVSPTRPDFEDVYRAQAQLNDILGPELKLKQDYISQPNSWGYTGRVHSILTDKNGMKHEVQVGTRDLTDFIDSPLETVGGDRTSLHDVTGYKGKVYGIQLPDRLEANYSTQLSSITETNRSGKRIADVSAVQNDVNQYLDEVQDALPERLNAPPTPEVSTRAEIGNISARGLGVLDIAGSALQVNQGVQTLRSNGDTIKGVVDIGAGSTGVVSGVALATGRIAAGTATGGVVAVLDGTKDLYIGVSDNSAEKIATGMVKAGAGAAMLAGVASANPLLIAGGAVAYGGAAIYDSREAISSAAGNVWSWTKSLF